MASVIIHFDGNPRNGGSPPKDSSPMNIMNCMLLFPYLLLDLSMNVTLELFLILAHMCVLSSFQCSCHSYGTIRAVTRMFIPFGPLLETYRPHIKIVHMLFWFLIYH
jgi:hypothetical protein